MRHGLLFLLVACTPGVDSVQIDADLDGVGVEDDCDDNDADVFPGAIEFCDRVDNDCDGDIDEAEDAWGLHDFWVDDDDDGYGDPDQVVQACHLEAGFVRPGDADCDDADPAANPDALEVCNQIDDDCDGTVDVDPHRFVYLDLDHDGYGTGEPVATCESFSYSGVQGDCDDLDGAVNPVATEACNGIDDDCDGDVDDADSEPPTDTTTWYPDADQDGFGALSYGFDGCAPPDSEGWTLTTGDCDDWSSAVHPDADELCNGVDDNCDGTSDPYEPCTP